MDKITQLFQRTALNARPWPAQHLCSGIASQFAAFRWIAAPLLRPVTLLLIVAFAFTASLTQAQTSSGTATARFNKDVSVSVVGENIRLKDAVAVTYTLTPAEDGAQITLLSHYNGTGQGETSGSSFTLIGTDQQTGTVSASAPVQVVISSFATLTQVGSTVSVRVRIDYLLTMTEDGDLIISITGVEVAQ
jgi:hypothetical protein